MGKCILENYNKLTYEKAVFSFNPQDDADTIRMIVEGDTLFMLKEKLKENPDITDTDINSLFEEISKKHTKDDIFIKEETKRKIFVKLFLNKIKKETEGTQKLRKIHFFIVVCVIDKDLKTEREKSFAKIREVICYFRIDKDNNVYLYDIERCCLAQCCKFLVFLNRELLKIPPEVSFFTYIIPSKIFMSLGQGYFTELNIKKEFKNVEKQFIEWLAKNNFVIYFLPCEEDKTKNITFFFLLRNHSTSNLKNKIEEIISVLKREDIPVLFKSEKNYIFFIEEISGNLIKELKEMILGIEMKEDIYNILENIDCEVSFVNSYKFEMDNFYLKSKISNLKSENCCFRLIIRGGGKVVKIPYYIIEPYLDKFFEEYVLIPVKEI